MTLYVYRSQNNKQINRPIKTRLLISVRFVPNVTETSIQQPTDIVSGTFLGAQQDAQTDQDAVSTTDPGDSPALLLRSGMSMRLRLVTGNASRKKEYHHAKSLSA